MGVCRVFRALARAACLAVLLAGACTAQLSATNTYKSPTGETVKFVGDSVSLKYWPSPSANCSQCYVAFKLGAVSELDAFGQPVAAHTIADLSMLEPEVTGGQRMSGAVSYQYVTMTFTASKLPLGLNKNNCPSLESIINQAYAAGVGPHDDLMSKFADEAAAQHRNQPIPTNLVGQQGAPELAQLSPFGRRLQQFGRWLPSIKITPSPPPGSPPPPPSPAAAVAPPPPSSPAQAPAADSKPSEAQSPAPSSSTPADNSKSPAEKPADQPAEQLAGTPAGKSVDKVDIVSSRRPADAPKADAAPASPASPQLAAPVAIEAPTSDQLLGPHKKAEPAAAPAPAAPAADTPKPAPAAGSPKAPAPAPEPAKDSQAGSGSGIIPIPPEKDDNDDSSSSSSSSGSSSSGSSSSDAAPVAPQPAPAAVQPVVEPTPAVLGPSVPASQAADLWRQQQQQQQQLQQQQQQQAAAAMPADSIHQQLQANGGYLPNPAASAGQAWGAYPGGNTPVHYGAGGYPVGVFGEGPPQIKVTFMFGFSHNKTFAYGRGRVVSAPAGSIKYTIEAQNWPFCSLYNSLKMEVVMASTVKDAQPQFVLSDAADVFEDMDSMRGPATRRLNQYRITQDAFIDFMDSDKATGKKGAAGIGGVGAGGLDMLGLNVGPIKQVSTAKMLVGPNLAAATEFPTYAFSSERFTSESNVSVVLATSKDAARFSLTFKYFDQGLFYDPTMFFTHKDDMMVAGSDVLPTVPIATMCKNETECGRGRRTRVQGNSSNMPSGALCLHSLLSAATVLLVVLLL